MPSKPKKVHSRSVYLPTVQASKKATPRAKAGEVYLPNFMIMTPHICICWAVIIRGRISKLLWGGCRESRGITMRVGMTRSLLNIQDIGIGDRRSIDGRSIRGRSKGNWPWSIPISHSFPSRGSKSMTHLLYS